MESILYQRIKELCAERGISINKLESELGFGFSSIQKWKNTSSPSMDKILKIATYFNVSVDYLLGRTDVKSSITEILGDDDIITFQRAREKMTPQDREKSLQMIRLAFGYAFGDDET